MSSWLVSGLLAIRSGRLRPLLRHEEYRDEQDPVFPRDAATKSTLRACTADPGKQEIVQ
jgi:hypothetical protein